MSQEVIALITGPTGALALAVGALVWLARVIVPMLKQYLNEQNKNLEGLVKAFEKNVEEHSLDRVAFEQAIKTLSNRIEAVEDAIAIIKLKL